MKKSTASHASYRLVPDVADQFVMPLKCNRQSAENIFDLHTHFPYRRYQLYLKTLAEIKHVRRIQKMSEDASGSSLLQFTSETWKKEFEGVYGRMDEEDPMYLKLLETYKESRLEEMEEAQETSGNQIPEDLPNITKLFSQEEIDLFTKVSAGAAEGKEVFVLPRKKLTTEEIARLTSVNLALFDPELSGHVGNRVIPAQAVSRDDRGVSEKLCCNIYEIISRHPAGIVAQQFLSEYKSRYDYLPNIAGLGYRSLAEFLVDLNNVVFTQGNGPNNDFVMYPTYLENLICSPMEMFWRINHKLLVILRFLGGFCKTEQLVDYFEQLYHMQLPFKAWGFETVDDFVVYLVENVKWKTDFYTVKKASVVEDNPEAHGHYVMLEKMSNVLERSGNSRCSAAIVTSAIRGNFILQPVPFPSESELIRKGDEGEFVVVYYSTPGDFEIVRASTWYVLNSYVQNWSQLYEDLKTKAPEGIEALKASSDSLRKGLPVVVFNRETEDYSRALYLKPDGKFKMHLVRFLDEGGTKAVDEEDIYYMDKSIMKCLRRQAITVGLHGLPHEHWSDDDMDFVYNLLCPPSRTVHFRTTFVAQDSKNGNWLVSMRDKQESEGHDIMQEVLSHMNNKEPCKSLRERAIPQSEFWRSNNIEAQSATHPISKSTNAQKPSFKFVLTSPSQKAKTQRTQDGWNWRTSDWKSYGRLNEHKVAESDLISNWREPRKDSSSVTFKNSCRYGDSAFRSFPTSFTVSNKLTSGGSRMRQQPTYTFARSKQY